MNARLGASVLLATACLLSVCLFPASAPAQGQAPATAAPGLADTTTNLYDVVQKRWIVAGKVTTLEGNPVSGARVDVQPTSASGAFRTLVTDFQGQSNWKVKPPRSRTGKCTSKA